MENTACALCGSDNPDPLFDLPDWYFNRPAVRVRLVRCPVCGLIYQDPPFSLAALEAAYPPEYQPFQPAARPGTKGGPIPFGLAQRRRLATAGRSGGRLLDVGCGAGAFLAAVAARPGWEAAGVEINPAAAETARALYGLPIFTGALEEAHYEAQRFDVVTLWDVLEHLPDPQAALGEIWRILKPGGTLLVRLPNAASWERRLFGQYWSGFEPPRHNYAFGPAQLLKMAARNGFAARPVWQPFGGYLNFCLSVRFWLTGSGVSPARIQQALRILHHPLARLAAVPVFALLNLGGAPVLIVRATKPPPA